MNRFYEYHSSRYAISLHVHTRAATNKFAVPFLCGGAAIGCTDVKFCLTFSLIDLDTRHFSLYARYFVNTSFRYRRHCRQKIIHFNFG